MDVFENLAKAMQAGDAGTFVDLLMQNQALFYRSIERRYRGLEAEELFQRMVVKFFTHFETERTRFARTMARYPDRTPVRLMRGLVWLRIGAVAKTLYIGINAAPVSLGGVDDEGEERAFDPEGEADDDATDAAEQWARRQESMRTLDPKWRAVNKLIQLTGPHGLREGWEPTDEEREWRPDPKYHPYARSFGDLVDAIRALGPVTEPAGGWDPWVAATLGLAGTPKQAQNIVAAWKKNARDQWAQRHLKMFDE